MDTHTLKITRPCPIELDVDRSGRQFFCDHCQKDVHVLGNWPRAEAEEFLAANRGRSVCVSLRRDSQGELLYADSPPRMPAPALVPVARLRRRWIPEAVAAAGVAAVLSACTPHQPIRGSEQLAAEEEASPCAFPEVTVPDGDPPRRAEEEKMLVGRIAVPPRIERGEKPAVEPSAPQRPRTPKAQPKPEKREPESPERADWDMVDGGLDL